MKRVICSILLMVFLLTLVGCGSITADPTQASTIPLHTDPPDTQNPDGLSPVTQKPMHSISVPIVTEYAYADDGRQIFSNTYQVMSLTVPDREVADKVIVDFLNRTDDAVIGADKLYEAACKQYNGSDSWRPFSCSVIYNPTRIDQSILSLFGTNSSYNGGSHPTHLNISLNYDMITGQCLSLDAILNESVTWECVCTMVINALTDIKADAQLYDSYIQKVRDSFRRDNLNYKNWYFSDSGLCFYFSPYEIAPYASGTVTAQLPYSMLTGIIKDQYFPPEYISDGEIFALRFEQADTSRFTQTCEITTDEGGQKILIHSGTNAVSNLRIISGSWDEDGIRFMPTGTILACSTLTPGDAVLVETFIPDVLPTLLIRYSSGGIDFERYIFQSGEDGSIILLDE